MRSGATNLHNYNSNRIATAGAEAKDRVTPVSGRAGLGAEADLATLGEPV